MPLPEGFSCLFADEFGGGELEQGTAQDFLDVLEYDCDPSDSIARFEDGKLMEVRFGS